MIILDDEGFELHSIYRKRIRLYWTSIRKIKLKKSYPSQIVGYVIVLTTYIDDGEYKFNINEFDEKEYFFRNLINKCAELNIHIIDLTSDEMKFLMNISLSLKRKLKKIFGLVDFIKKIKENNHSVFK